MSDLMLQGVGMTSQRTRERLIQRLMDQGVTNMRVLDVMRNTPRHIFLDEALAHRAYEDTALPIGHGQTLSQPYTVARMTEILIGAAGSVRNSADRPVPWLLRSRPVRASPPPWLAKRQRRSAVGHHIAYSMSIDRTASEVRAADDAAQSIVVGCRALEGL